MLTAMGVEAFAERARRELAATGETARKRTVATSSQLTAHEALIARMAREGLSNPENGTRLFCRAVASIQLPPTTTCSNVTRALMAEVDSARSKGGSVERTVHTPDGRTLAVEDCGDPAGRPVLVHTGTPNSRHLYGPNVADAAERGLRLIGYDRPGYGESSPQ
ncbi:MAG: alpha/beta fold hydrolase, partial [Streptosporangiaceae bacterium]